MREPLLHRRPILHPSRWPILAGLALIVVAAFLPWQTLLWTGLPHETLTGMSGWSAPGMELILFSLATLGLAALPVIAESRVRVVQCLPAILGVAVLLITAGQYRQMVEGADTPGRPAAVVEWGFWVALLASGVVALGGLTTSIAIWRDRPARHSVGLRPAALLSMLTPVISFVGGLAVGIILAVAATPVMGNAGGAGAPAVVLVGTIVGAIAIFRLLNSVWPSNEKAPRRRSEPGSDLPDLERVQRPDRRS